MSDKDLVTAVFGINEAVVTVRLASKERDRNIPWIAAAIFDNSSSGNCLSISAVSPSGELFPKCKRCCKALRNLGKSQTNSSVPTGREYQLRITDFTTTSREAGALSPSLSLSLPLFISLCRSQGPRPPRRHQGRHQQLWWWRGEAAAAAAAAAACRLQQRQRRGGAAAAPAAAAVAAAVAAASNGGGSAAAASGAARNQHDSRSVDSCTGTARDIKNCSGSSSTSYLGRHLMLCSYAPSLASLPTHTLPPCSCCSALTLTASHALLSLSTLSQAVQR